MEQESQGYVLLISQDVIGAQMAGPGIRYYQLAQTLTREFPVVLAVPDDGSADYPPSPFRIIPYRRLEWSSIAPLLNAARVAILPSDIASDFPQLEQTTVPVVVDGYDPMLAEWLSLSQDQELPAQQIHWTKRMQQLNRQYLIGDFFVCANERQRDWWLGLLEANGRINPCTFRDDPSLRRLVNLVPYGLPNKPPLHTRSVIRGIWPGIGVKDYMILWGGGLWTWLDPLTAVRAIEQVWQRRQDVRLVFPGTRRPNSVLAGIPTHVEAAQALAGQLGLLNKAVFFGEWVPYSDWPNVLLESDIALTLHFSDSFETRLAFRSRVLEYIWAGLPIIATGGDATSELIAQYGLGILVESQDVPGVAEAILHLLDTPRQSFEKRFENARESLTWERAAQPLIEFCRHPRRAPDKLAFGANLGNPSYVSEIDQLKALVKAFQQRRIIRLVDWVQSTGVHRVLRRIRNAGHRFTL